MGCLNEAPDEGAAQARGIQASRFCAEADGKSLADISALIEAGALRPPHYQTFPLEAAAEAKDLR